ncbi:MAG: uncharacterized protein KVP18_002220 [Porospora cf. gigantea A]|uniref:uncharacterized protein n=1 Tax=Porospora cf. gigantea A TaxID=2853593 RepID=UPI003559726E|nr:MAG: hypothetical protein KVP18_002220 [Porospora cf. gigantea A]
MRLTYYNRQQFTCALIAIPLPDVNAPARPTSASDIYAALLASECNGSEPSLLHEILSAAGVTPAYRFPQFTSEPVDNVRSALPIRSLLDVWNPSDRQEAAKLRHQIDPSGEAPEPPPTKLVTHPKPAPPKDPYPKRPPNLDAHPAALFETKSRRGRPWAPRIADDKKWYHTPVDVLAESSKLCGTTGTQALRLPGLGFSLRPLSLFPPLTRLQEHYSHFLQPLTRRRTALPKMNHSYYPLVVPTRTGLNPRGLVAGTIPAGLLESVGSARQTIDEILCRTGRPRWGVMTPRQFVRALDCLKDLESDVDGGYWKAQVLEHTEILYSYYRGQDRVGYDGAFLCEPFLANTIILKLAWLVYLQLANSNLQSLYPSLPDRDWAAHFLGWVTLQFLFESTPDAQDALRWAHLFSEVGPVKLTCRVQTPAGVPMGWQIMGFPLIHDSKRFTDVYFGGSKEMPAGLSTFKEHMDVISFVRFGASPELLTLEHPTELRYFVNMPTNQHAWMATLMWRARALLTRGLPSEKGGSRLAIWQDELLMPGHQRKIWRTPSPSRPFPLIPQWTSIEPFRP